MTLVDIYQTVPDGEVGDPESPAIGYQTWEPTGPGARRRADAPAREVLPAPFRVDLLSTGATTIEVAPTGETWAWFVSEYVDGILPTSRTIAIPDVDRIDFRDCPQIDPKTLDPIISSPSPVWVQQLAELTDEIASAQGHEEAAELAAEQAAGSALSAADSAQSAANSALSASGSAGTAATKASEATTSANTATAKANESTTSAATASTKANEAANSATAAANSLASASTKANEAANSATSAANSASTATTKANEATAAAATATDKANSMSAYTASDVLNKLKTVDGAGSGLDADLLDGHNITDITPVLTNLLTNSDFSNGTTGWSLGVGWAVVGGVLVANEAASYVAYQGVGVPPIINGNKYYLRMNIVSISTGSTEMHLGGMELNALQTVAGVFSAVITARSSNGTVVIQSGGFTGTIDSALCIDLTATFGAGKEPTKAEMDAIMAKWGGWFAKETPKPLPTYDWGKLTQGAATNLVTNGDFSNGTTGWSGSGANLTNSSNTLIGTGTTGSSVVIVSQQDRDTVPGNKYYAAFQLRTTTTDSTRLHAFICGVDTTGVPNPTINQWYAASTVVTAVSANGKGLFFYNYVGGDRAGKTLEVKTPLLIDLTKVFGAGNEPSKTEMDYLLSKYPNSWFNGTVNDLVSRFDPKERFGTGMPNGVITAAPGSYYTDTIGTNGAWRWLKKSGTGNTGWECIVGDTGWRNITSWDAAGTVTGAALPAGVAPTTGVAGSVRILRKDGRVLLAFRGATWAQSASFNTPAGFQASSARFSLVTGSANIVATIGVAFVTLGASGFVANPAYATLAEWDTADAWPTVLPGTPA